MDTWTWRLMRVMCIVAAMVLPADAFEWKGQRVTFAAPDAWQDVTTQVLADWNACGVLRLRLARRGMVRVEVMDYGYTDDWAGLTSVNVQDGIATSATIRINQFWLDRNWLGLERNILCHEVGHAIGLPHNADPVSCVRVGAYSATPAETDCARLRAMYA